MCADNKLNPRELFESYAKDKARHFLAGFASLKDLTSGCSADAARMAIESIELDIKTNVIDKWNLTQDEIAAAENRATGHAQPTVEFIADHIADIDPLLLYVYVTILAQTYSNDSGSAWIKEHLGKFLTTNMYDARIRLLKCYEVIFSNTMDTLSGFIGSYCTDVKRTVKAGQKTSPLTKEIKRRVIKTFNNRFSGKRSVNNHLVIGTTNYFKDVLKTDTFPLEDFKITIFWKEKNISKTLESRNALIFLALLYNCEKHPRTKFPFDVVAGLCKLFLKSKTKLNQDSVTLAGRIINHLETALSSFDRLMTLDGDKAWYRLKRVSRKFDIADPFGIMYQVIPKLYLKLRSQK